MNHDPFADLEPREVSLVQTLLAQDPFVTWSSYIWIYTQPEAPTGNRFSYWASFVGSLALLARSCILLQSKTFETT